MKFRIALFAGVSQRAQKNEICVEFDSPPNANELLERLASELPDAADLIRVSRVAVNESFVDGKFVIERPDFEIALIPPVSGG